MMLFFDVFKSILEDVGLELSNFQDISMSGECDIRSYSIDNYDLHLFLVKRSGGILVFVQSLSRENPLFYFRIADNYLNSNEELEFYAQFLKKQIDFIQYENM